MGVAVASRHLHLVRGALRDVVDEERPPVEPDLGVAVLGLELEAHLPARRPQPAGGAGQERLSSSRRARRTAGDGSRSGSARSRRPRAGRRAAGGSPPPASASAAWGPIGSASAMLAERRRRRPGFRRWRGGWWMLGAGCSRLSPSVCVRSVTRPSESGLRPGQLHRKAGPSMTSAPPWRSAVARTSASPRPDPPAASASGPRQKRPVAASARCGGIPAPESVTASTTAAGVDSTETRTGPPGGPWRWALSTRFRSARSSACRSPRTSAGPSASTATAASPHRRPARELGDVDGSSGTAPASSRARARRSSTRRLSRSASAWTSASVSGSAPWASRYAAFPRSAVIGFRSSCDASATKRRSASRGLLERGEHAVQRLGEAVDLVGAGPAAAGQAERGIAGALDHGGAGRQPLERAQGAARRGAARAGTRARPRAARPRRSAARDCSSVSLTSSVDAATITAPPPAGPAEVGERRDVDAHLVPAQRAVAVAAAAASDRRRDQCLRPGRSRPGARATARRSGGGGRRPRRRSGAAPPARRARRPTSGGPVPWR